MSGKVGTCDDLGFYQLHSVCCHCAVTVEEWTGVLRATLHNRPERPDSAVWVVNAPRALVQLDCLGWVNCLRLVSLVSKRFQEAEPVEGNWAAHCRSDSKYSGHPSSVSSSLWGLEDVRALRKGSSWAPCCGSVLFQAKHHWDLESK